MPARKKDPSVRARSNRASTARTLSNGSRSRAVPELPAHPTSRWHEQTAKWWREIWTSPLPDAWQSFDLGSVFTLALAYNDIWIAESATARKEALGEYRLQRKDFFIAPYNRLQGEIVIEEADAAKDRGRQRRERTVATRPAAKKAAADPRSILRAVK
jgi:hypothetical protein